MHRTFIAYRNFCAGTCTTRSLLFTVLLCVCGMAYSQTDSLPYIPVYDTVMYETATVDRLCRLERERAVTDAGNNKLYFTDPAIYRPRYARFMSLLCRPYHLTYWWVPEARLGYAGFNPLRCYVAAADSVVKQRYGAYFKAMLVARADSFFLAQLHTDTLDEQYCNPRPTLHNDSIYSTPYGEFFHTPVDTTLYNKYVALSRTHVPPFMDVNLFIDTTGTVRAYRLLHFFSACDVYYTDTLQHTTVYGGCGNDFWQQALALLKKYPQWKPGYIGSTPVKTWHRVRIFFTPAPSAFYR